MMPSNREWALLIWGGMLLALALSNPGIRSSLRGVLRAASSPKILVPLFVMIAWVIFEAWLAARIAPWSGDLTKGVIVWFITAGIVLFGNFEEASKKANFFRRKIFGILAWPVFIEFYLDLYHLPLWGELLLQPLLAFLTVVSVIAAQNEKSGRVVTCVGGLLALAGVSLLAFVVVRTVQAWGDLNASSLLVQFALPAWLTVGVLPFVFCLALYSGYESAYVRSGLNENATRWGRVRTLIAIAVGMHLRVREVSNMTGYWLRKVSEAPSFGTALSAVRDYLIDRESRERREFEKKERLKRFAGVEGADVHGLQLDRREFESTTHALNWLATCMTGWYDREDRYQPDLLERIEGGFDRYEFEPLGIEMNVSDNGQSWYGWRRTVTGWCFAIGAAGPPPNQWEYDGPKPPGGFPGSDPSWGKSPFTEDAKRNWQ